MLEGLHGGFLTEGAEVELQRAEYHVVRQVLLIDADHKLQRVAGDLLGHIDDAGVIFLALTSHEHEETVADIEDGFVINHNAFVISSARAASCPSWVGVAALFSDAVSPTLVVQGTGTCPTPVPCDILYFCFMMFSIIIN